MDILLAIPGGVGHIPPQRYQTREFLVILPLDEIILLAESILQEGVLRAISATPQSILPVAVHGQELQLESDIDRVQEHQLTIDAVTLALRPENIMVKELQSGAVDVRAPIPENAIVVELQDVGIPAPRLESAMAAERQEGIVDTLVVLPENVTIVGYRSIVDTALLPFPGIPVPQRVLAALLVSLDVMILLPVLILGGIRSPPLALDHLMHFQAVLLHVSTQSHRCMYQLLEHILFITQSL